MSMVETIARAMYDSLHEQNADGGWVETDPVSMLSVELDGNFDFEAFAQAALRAMETPTEAMVEAAREESSFVGLDHAAIDAETMGVYTAMIRAAVAEGER